MGRGEGGGGEGRGGVEEGRGERYDMKCKGGWVGW